MAILIDPDAFYDPTEYAPVSGKSPATQAKDRSLGQGCPYVKLGRRILYRGADILAHLEERRVRHGAEYKSRFAAARPQGKTDDASPSLGAATKPLPVREEDGAPPPSRRGR